MERPNLFKAIGMAIRNPQGVLDASNAQMVASVVPQEPEASPIAAYVSEPVEAWGVYAKEGVPDKTGVTFDTLRKFSYRMTPANAILSTRVNQASRFCQRYTSSRYGLVEEPSFRVRLRDRERTPTPEDTANIKAWEEFFEMSGWCPPPEQDRPIGWRPGLDYLIKPLVRDTFTIDFVPFKTFAQVGQEKQFPIVSMCLDDGALYRNAVGRKTLDESTGKYKIIPFDGERTNARRSINLVRLMGDQSYLPMGEFTSAEVSMFQRNIRVDEQCYGYGFPEMEQGLDSISSLLEIRRHNLDRFRKDRLPRGFFLLQGKVGQTARGIFENRISQMLTRKDWSIPILQVDPPNQAGQAGTQLEWVDINQAMKEGEYAQLAYTMLTELHAVCHISMEETGMSQASPFSAGLSEASPESTIKHSQSHFANLMVDIANFFNRNILWKSPSAKNYMFEWVGLGDRNYMEEEQMAGLMLQNGTITLRMLYKYRDLPLPRSIENSPAVDLPMPFAQSLQYLDQKEQEQMQQGLMEKQQADQEAQQEAQARMGRVRTPGASSISGGDPQGASDGSGGDLSQGGIAPMSMPQMPQAQGMDDGGGVSGMNVPQPLQINLPKPPSPSEPDDDDGDK